MKYHIQYIENDQTTSESFMSDNMGLILSWFVDSFLHHTGLECGDDVMRILKDTGGVCVTVSDVKHEWVIDC